MDQLCTDIGARVGAVDAGKHLVSAPLGTVPPNIYGADGDWESFSTPGRDQKLRASFREIFQLVSKTATSSPDLVSKLSDIWNQHQTSCNFTYTSSAGNPVNLTLNDVQARLFQLSFDPDACAEMRWGAYPDHSNEYASCSTQDDAHVQRWKDEGTLRNIIDRPLPGTATPFGFGPQDHEDVDVVALLHRLAQ
jgi:hypothetical protein